MNSESSFEQKILRAVRNLPFPEKKFEDLLPELTQVLAENFDAQWISCWSMNKSLGGLKLSKLWCAPLISVEALEEDAHNRLFCAGEGMVGKVWRLRHPLISTNLIKDMMLPRSLKAYSAGFREGLWFPIYGSKAPYGVIEILKSEFVFFDPKMLLLLESLGKELGNYIDIG